MEKIELKDLDISINSGELISIIGPNGSGKTLILKKLSGKIKTNDIYIDNININKYSLEYKQNNIICILNDTLFNTKTPKEELSYYLNKLNISKEEINNRLNNFIEFFDLENILNNLLINMNIEERFYIKILSLLIIIPNIVCVDNILTYLNKDKKMKILNYIKEKNMTLINVTSDMEELIYFDKILVINKGKKYLFDKTEKVLSNNTIFQELGLNLPFIYDINNLLKEYSLIKENHLIHKELVDLLWK